MRESVTTSTTHQYFHSWVWHRNMQLHFSVTFACCGNVEILVSTWCEAEVVHSSKMILGKNYWCADSPGLQVYKSASLQVCKSAGLQVCKSAGLQVCKSASLQVCSLQVSHTGYEWLIWMDDKLLRGNTRQIGKSHNVFASFQFQPGVIFHGSKMKI